MPSTCVRSLDYYKMFVYSTGLLAATWKLGHFLCCTGLSPNTHNVWMLDKEGERELGRKQGKRETEKIEANSDRRGPDTIPQLIIFKVVVGIELQMQTGRN